MQVIDQTTTREPVGQFHNRWTLLVPRVVLSVLVGVVVGLALIAFTNRPNFGAGSLTASSYREYAEAMAGLTGLGGAGALTGDSYRDYAEAMAGLRWIPDAAAVTGNSYQDYAEAIRKTSPPDSAALTGNSYRAYAEAMRRISPPDS